MSRRSRTVFPAVIVCLAALLWSIEGQAISIGFQPASQSVVLGDSVLVDIVVSDLGGEIVSAYDLDIGYDAAILSAVSVTFGPLLGDEAFFEVFSDFDLSTPGLVDLAQLSLLSDAALLALQGGDSVVLATLGFATVGMGATSLDFTFDVFNDIKGLNALQLDIDAVAGTVGVIPEPHASLLFALGVLVFSRAARRSSGAPRK